MQWYDYLLISLGLIGIFLALVGSYYGHGARKSGVWGWIIIISLLIIRVSIWLYNSIAQ